MYLVALRKLQCYLMKDYIDALAVHLIVSMSSFSDIVSSLDNFSNVIKFICYMFYSE